MITVGQTVYAVPHRGDIEELIISKVGKKYFYATTSNGSRERQFLIETMRENQTYGSPATVYLSIRAYEAELELNKLTHLIREVFTRHGRIEITLEQAREIYTILFGKEYKDGNDE